MKSDLRELYKYRELLVMIAVRDIKVRYKQSLMGFFWAILMPVLIVASGILVRYGYSIASHKPLDMADLVSVATKSVPWAFFVSTIRFSSLSLIGNQNLVTKVYFPKEIFPMAVVLSQLFDLMIATSVLVVLLAVARLHVTVQLLWAAPLMAIVIVMALGVGLLVSAGSLFYRDVKYIVEVFLTFAIFFTPVFYDVSMFGQKGRFLLLNPIAPLLEGFSDIVHGNGLQWNWIFYSIAVALVMLLGAYLVFKKAEPNFAQSI
jgi:ABC-type polysaccharide/polyol phosphate export permease